MSKVSWNIIKPTGFCWDCGRPCEIGELFCCEKCGKRYKQKHVGWLKSMGLD